MSNNKLHVATWNIYNGSPLGFSVNADIKRIEKINEHIKNSDCDIIGLQEINNISLVNILNKNFGEKYKIYYEECSKTIEYCILFILLFIMYYCGKDIVNLCIIFIFVNFILRNSTIYNFIMSEIKGGEVLLIKKKLIENEENENKITHEYKDFKEQKGDFLNLINKRGYQQLKISYKNNIINIINCHLNQGNDESSRNNQLLEILDNSKDNQFNIILGDLNMNLKSSNINIKNYNLKDTLEDEDIKTWDKNNYLIKENIINKDNENIKPDYILYKNFNLICSKLIFNNPIASDHYGIDAKLNLKDKIKKKKKKGN